MKAARKALVGGGRFELQRHRVVTTVLLLAFVASGFLLPSHNLVAGELSAGSPMISLIREAERRHKSLNDQVADYTCMLVKRERVDGRLLDHEYAELKLRHRQVRDGRIVVPFSVYLKFFAPAVVQGREVIFVEGRNNGELIARRGGQRFAYMTASIDPLGALAMERNRYPITQVGIGSLIEETLVVAEEELQTPAEELQFRQIDGVRMNGRSCRALQFTHPIRRDRYRYHVARVFVDEELDLPVRYAAYDWPDEDGGRPRLLEEYTYLNLKFNVGLTDEDFDHRNESYQFNKKFQPELALASRR